MPNRLRNEEVLRRLHSCHPTKNFDYSKVEYIDSKTKVCIICPDHGEFWQTLPAHSIGIGCSGCRYQNSSNTLKENAKSQRPDLSHIGTPEGSKAVPVGTKGDYALVDDEDYDRVMEHNWRLTKNGYAFNGGVGMMHRVIMNTPDGMYTDHKFHNKLDNRKSQLRVCTKQQNGMNSKRRVGTSKYKGVSFYDSTGKWWSYIFVGGKTRHMGFFDDEIEAARAYDEAAKKYFKEFANLNFPDN